MPKRTNTFQKLVFLVKKHAATNATITESKLLRDNITNTNREVDIYIESTVAGHQVGISVECRDRGRKADVAWVEEMKAKHERLPTNALVLVSSSGFTKEATTIARKYGIETIALDLIDADSVERLFGNASTLWFKFFTLNPTKVVIRVAPVENLAAENVVVSPDNIVYNYKGEETGLVKGLVESLLHAEYAIQQLGKLGDESHKGFEILWKPAQDTDGHPFCLQMLTPRILRPIEYVKITGSCNFDISEFPLHQGKLGNVSIAWGSGLFLGKNALLVASEEKSTGKKFSITTEKFADKHPPKQHSR